MKNTELNSKGKTHLVVLGSGFAAYSLLKKLDYRKYAVTLVSPRNHFLFTPLLPSTAVGTIEFRSIIEPVRNLQPRVTYYRAACESVDIAAREIVSRSTKDSGEFVLNFDNLIIATGVQPNTWGIPGVRDYACFLNSLNDARNIRQRILDNFEQASLPDTEDNEKYDLLHFVICGGGPTGIEFAAEVYDFVVHETGRYFPQLIPYTRITLVEAGPGILTAFDAQLREKAMHLFHRQNIRVLLENPVKTVGSDFIKLASGKTLNYGLLLWAAGNAPVPFVEGLPCSRDRSGRILTNPFLRIPGCEYIYALGDCSVIDGMALPQTAQAAMQQGKYLARHLNDPRRTAPFKFKSLGALAYIGSDTALVETPAVKGSGFLAWLFWRSVYLTRIVRLRNKIKVVVDWLLNMIFGRDISQF